MTQRLINYTSADFASIKNDLVNYAKRYYPNSFQDFNEASFGALMLDLVAYVGDQLSYYADYHANEAFLETALETENIVKSARQMGYRIPGAASSTGMLALYVIVPADSSVSGPDANYIPIMNEGSTFGSQGGTVFTLVENVDFADPNNEITVARVDTSTGIPTHFAIKTYGKIVSGQELVQNISVGNYERFLSLKINTPNVSEILSVTDTEGHEYYEVESLAQDVIYQQIPNYNSDKEDVKYKLRTVPAPRRFTVENRTNGFTFINFGYGSANNITKDVITDPSDVVLKVTGRNYQTDETFDPSKLVESDKFGVNPTNTTLTVKYRTGGNNLNAARGTITRVINASLSYNNPDVISTVLVNEVQSSIELENEDPILGDISTLTPEELKVRAFATFATQNRAVTRTDYINLAYRMPSKFGKIKRVNVIQDKDSFKRNLNMYVLSENSAGNFVQSNATIKENLKQWLNTKRMINDTIDILDGRVINIGINFEILADLDVNRFKVLDDCVEAIKNNYLNVKRNMGEALYLSEIYKILNDVPGVTDTTSVEVVNKTGGIYSTYPFPVKRNLSPDGRFLKVPEDSVVEVLVPESDIKGVVK